MLMIRGISRIKRIFSPSLSRKTLRKWNRRTVTMPDSTRKKVLK